MTALLSVEGLTTHLHTDVGVVRAVDDVSLAVAPGEAVALVGESGCGKSMTALSMMRLAPPAARIEAGRVMFKGRDLLGLSARQMRRVRGGEMGMVFQDPMTFLNPLIRIGDQVEEAISLHMPERGRAAALLTLEALRRVRIADPEQVMGYYPHQLSGGMRQRVLIAIAIACRPSLLICDEPTTALDVTIQAQIMDLLRGLRAELGSAILLITHDLGLVAEYCDRVYVMYAGRVVEEASVFDVFARPRHPYTRALLRSTLRLDRRADGFRTIAGQPPNLVHPPPGCRFHPRCPEAFARCRTDEPDLYGSVGARARCLLHAPEAA
ncbi:MAG: ABC transporter ATP-binding protein [Alphaproteobacteria bacterium]|nr:ABC transporter ATP-binding protein [Alphaproteobacteria bacterium]